MKAKILFIIIVVPLVLAGCVQKSYDRTLIFTIDRPNIQDIKSVGVRGNDKPLNWENDLPLKFDSKSNTYKATVTLNSGYLFTEVKFTVNGEFELKNQENRRIDFRNKDTIYYHAAFDKR